MANDSLRAAVDAELSWEPRVDGTDITVSAEGGRVTLHGTVTRFRQKREADAAARRVYGVTAISNFLEVHIPDQDRRADADVRADVRQVLALNDLIPATVQASVDAGLVTLSGVAAWKFQRDEAELACSAVPGIMGVDVAISLLPSLPTATSSKRSAPRSRAAPGWTGSRYRPTAHFPAWLFFLERSAPGPNAMTPSPSPGPRRASPTSTTGSRSSTSPTRTGCSRDSKRDGRP